MTLHYRPPNFIMLGLYFLAGAFVIYTSQTGYELTVLFIPLGSTALLIFGLLPILGALWGVRQALRPDPVTIDQTGLVLRVAGINRVVPWAAIAAVFLEPHVNPGNDTRTHRLVIVPAPGVDLGTAANYQNKADGRPSIILVALDDLRESYAEVTQALATYAGPRLAAQVSNPEPGPSV
ncbi:hypothetical protein AB0K00_14905 [Dactylosporangium sp. NPDC049525]|uniref:hypothetical protein n=1 Tax=Dactylosporangium sp. NPDC049525 TaxID=3154730 RepID=UPI00341B36A0